MINLNLFKQHRLPDRSDEARKIKGQINREVKKTIDKVIITNEKIDRTTITYFIGRGMGVIKKVEVAK